MFPVELRDKALGHWEAIDPVLQFNNASCRMLLVAKLDKAANLSDQMSLFYASFQIADESAETFAPFKTIRKSVPRDARGVQEPYRLTTF